MPIVHACSRAGCATLAMGQLCLDHERAQADERQQLKRRPLRQLAPVAPAAALLAAAIGGVLLKTRLPETRPVQAKSLTASEVAAAFATAVAVGDGTRLLALLAAPARLAIVQAWIDANHTDGDIRSRDPDQFAQALIQLSSDDPISADFKASVGAAFSEAFAGLDPATAAVETRERGPAAIVRYLSTGHDQKPTLLAILLEERQGEWEVSAYSNRSLQPEPIEPSWPRRSRRG